MCIRDSNNLVRNVRFENIRIEDFRQGQLVNLRIFFNKKYCAAPGRGIENVIFKDITYNGENAELSIIAGSVSYTHLWHDFQNHCLHNTKRNSPGYYKLCESRRVRARNRICLLYTSRCV